MTTTQQVWQSVPDAHCKGLCAESCGPVGASEVEKAVLAERGIRLLDPLNELVRAIAGTGARDCPALVDGRCSVYDVRPTVCRLWGVVEDMPCPHGCVPDGGLLPSEQGHRLLAQSIEVGQLRSRRDRRKQRQ